MIRAVTLTLMLATAPLAAYGGDDPAVAATTAASAATAGGAKKLKAVRSQFGRILADGRGQAVYLFDREATSTPRCYGACAKAWPPVLTRGRPVAGKGAGGAELGTTRRRKGARQVTLDGRPLYYYVDDTPGRVLCHNVHEFGGLWLVVRPDGSPVA